MTTPGLSQKVRLRWNKGYAYGYWSVVYAGKWHWTSEANRSAIRAFRKQINLLNTQMKYDVGGHLQRPFR